MADDPRVLFVTSLGNFVVELAAKQTPVTVENFLKYVDDGFYNGTIFHRVIADFMIQGGGFTGIERQKQTGLRSPIRNEAPQGLKNERGTIAMARTNAPHSATSQFFINVQDNAMLDPAPQNIGYCAFGRVVEGMDVVDQIRRVPTCRSDLMGGEKSQPVDPPVVQKVGRIAVRQDA